MINRGQYQIIRIDGTETLVQSSPTLDDVRTAIGCECMDIVLLACDEYGRPGPIMMVDDTGILSGKRVNTKATEIFKAYRPSASYPIYGDVVIAHDEDFGTANG